MATLGNNLLSSVSPFLSAQNPNNNLFKYLNPTTDLTRYGAPSSGSGLLGLPKMPTTPPNSGSGNPGVPPPNSGSGNPPSSSGGSGNPPNTGKGEIPGFPGSPPPPNTGKGKLPGLPGSPPPPIAAPAGSDAYTQYLYSWQQPMLDWWNTFEKTNSRAPTQDEWTKQFQDTIDPTGVMQISPAVANDLYQWGVQYYHGAGHGYQANDAPAAQATANELDQLLQQNQSQIPFAYKTGESLPYQINPAVWDSLQPFAQQLTLSAVKAMGGDPNAWLAQLNAARPVGTIPKLLETVYRQPPTGRSQFTGQAGAY